jgi:glycerol-3-phosphate dehydrogenase (NAD(P)+)
MINGSKITVMGSGAWGTAIAIAANRAGADVTLWTKNDKLCENINKNRLNDIYLPDVFIEPSIKVTNDLGQAVKADVIVLAIPAQAVRPFCINLSDMIDINLPLVIAAKGIERGSLLLMTEVVSAILPSNPTLVISGPNFAREAAIGLPTATVIASNNLMLAEQFQFLIGGKHFRPYISDDVIAVQIGGAIKNVIAIACGIAIGAGMGENARAAIMTRGLREMMRLAEVKGGKAETLRGLAGMGDLTLSCASEQSRNMAFGVNIGKMSLQNNKEKIYSWHSLTEGVMTAEAAYEISHKFGVPMPICVTIADILKNRINVKEGIDRLLSRPLGGE